MCEQAGLILRSRSRLMTKALLKDTDGESQACNPACEARGGFRIWCKRTRGQHQSQFLAYIQSHPTTYENIRLVLWPHAQFSQPCLWFDSCFDDAKEGHNLRRGNTWLPILSSYATMKWLCIQSDPIWLNSNFCISHGTFLKPRELSWKSCNVWSMKEYVLLTFFPRHLHASSVPNAFFPYLLNLISPSLSHVGQMWLTHLFIVQQATNLCSIFWV